MPKFIVTDRVAVTDEDGSTVWVRRKMDLGTVSRVQGAKPGEALIALYVHNILAWNLKDEHGRALACTPEVIETIDPNDPFWERVGTMIADLNKKADADPLDATTAGAAASPASPTSPAESTIST